jgi:hypothetical protein
VLLTRAPGKNAGNEKNALNRRNKIPGVLSKNGAAEEVELQPGLNFRAVSFSS